MKLKLKLRYALLGLALTLLLPVAGCGTGKPDTLQYLKLGVLPVEDNFPLFVAEQKKMFTEAGLNVELVPFNSARDRDIALVSGQIDGEVADIIAAALLKKSGTDVRIVSLTLGATPQEGRFALLSAPNSGISTPAQLAGVPVAVSQYTIIEYVADQLLRQAGVASDQISKTVVAAIPDRMQLLLSGSVKAAVLPDPMATLAELQGAHVVLDDTKSAQNLTQVVLLFRSDALGTKTKAVRKLIRTYAASAAEVTSHPGDYREIFVEKARVPEQLKGSYQIPKYSPPQLPATADVERALTWMVERGLLTKAYTYDEMVDGTLLAGN